MFRQDVYDKLETKDGVVAHLYESTFRYNIPFKLDQLDDVIALYDFMSEQFDSGVIEYNSRSSEAETMLKLYEFVIQYGEPDHWKI